MSPNLPRIATWVRAGVSVLVLGSTFAIGFLAGRRALHHRPVFHDIPVNHAADYMKLVDPKDPAVRRAAGQFETPQQAYFFVRDAIVFDPSLDVSPPRVILNEKRASCLGKAILLCSLYRAMGYPPENVRIFTGEVATPNFTAEHAWLDLEHEGVCLQQDPTSLLGLFAFNQFPGYEYTRAFVRREGLCFNDKGFAIVSQLNRVRARSYPAATTQLP